VSETLVLDVGMRPIARIPWTEAIIKILIDKKARIIEEYPDRYINTVNWTIQMPSVIMLLIPVKRSKAIKFSRHGIYSRDKGKCQYCGNRVSKNEFQYEHVIPRSQGGRTSWENIVVACLSCNQRKGGRTPAQASMRLLSTPVRPKSLPDMGSHGMGYNPSMPASWEPYLRSHAYWNTPLEED
jgi:5-methylcytosine-specific restriction endonuclease McrA